MDINKKHGGPRPGTGPKFKPEEEKKVQVTLYIKKCIVEKEGLALLKKRLTLEAEKNNAQL